MNQKELGELRRRFQPDRSAVSRIYGCYVNTQREVISYLDESLGRMPLEESEKYLGLLKKSLSGALGKNLIDVVFTTEQVMDSDEYRLLSALRESELKNGEIRQEFYQRVIESLDMGESNYLILMAYDAYDVPRRGGDGQPGDSENVYRCILCCVCPVKDGKPELGFLYPAFDDRTANLYNALFYTRKADQLHQEFIDAIFRTEAPMSAAEQREAFETALQEGLEEACSMAVVQSVHEQLRERLEEHRDSKDPEPLSLTAGEVGAILRQCGVEEARVEAFQAQCAQRFGESAALNPANLIDSKRFEVKTGEVTVSVDPACSYLVETREIDGRRYLLIPVGEDVVVNGLPVTAGGAEAAGVQP